MSGGYGSHEIVGKLKACHPLLGTMAKMLYPPMPTLNTIPAEDLRSLQETLFMENASVVNIGAGRRSGSGARLWKTERVKACRVIDIDIERSSAPDVIADALNLPFADNSVDSVVVQAVFEHLPDVDKAAAEVKRVLKKGGCLYVEMPFLQGQHADPADFRRYTIEGLRNLFSGWDEVRSGVSVGPFCTLVWVVRDGISHLFRNKWLYAFSRFMAAWMLAPLRYLDLLIRKTESFSRLACEYYYLCRKK